MHTNPVWWQIMDSYMKDLTLGTQTTVVNCDFMLYC